MLVLSIVLFAAESVTTGVLMAEESTVVTEVLSAVVVLSELLLQATNAPEMANTANNFFIVCWFFLVGAKVAFDTT